MENKTYILQKDLPNLIAGATLIKNGEVYETLNDKYGKYFSLYANVIENNPEWFKLKEEVKKDYEILVFNTPGKLEFFQWDEFKQCKYSQEQYVKQSIDLKLNIHTVRCISTDTVWSIGMNTNFGEIKSFVITGDKMFCEVEFPAMHTLQTSIHNISELKPAKETYTVPKEYCRTVPYQTFSSLADENKLLKADLAEATREADKYQKQLAEAQTQVEQDKLYVTALQDHQSKIQNDYNKEIQFLKDYNKEIQFLKDVIKKLK